MAAAGIAVSVSMGVMKPVLEKLATLLGDKYKKLKGLRKEVSFLVDELSEMKALLEKMDEAVDELDSQAKKWRKDIIDMSYDIEDCIDDFMDRVGEASDKQVGILKKASHYLITIKDQYSIANQINKIKARVIEASQRRERYNIDFCTTSTTSPVAIDPRLTALYKDSTSLVGTDTQKQELVRWALDERQQYLRIMPIVGFGGLGKTTLANEVYREVREHFKSNAFVSVSQKPDIARLLNIMHSKLGLPSSSHAQEVQELIDNLREYLQDKRYFIVIDDLWEVNHWDIISCAFPPNGQPSRIIVTTRIESVARACPIDHWCIHYMKPLSEVDSRKLFFRRTFGSEDACPPQFTQVSSEILKKCGGLPLAIVTMASTLANKPKEYWDYLQRSMVTDSAANSLDNMMHILDLSYKHLPHHLRACFLYLGIYPEDYEIHRDQLIDLWVAERIVMSKSPGQDVKDVAKSYFNELVNRNMMVQLNYDNGYRVHDMMLDLIMKRCREDNFVSVVHSAQVVVERQDRVHRLSVSLSDADDDIILQEATNCCRSQVRSLVLFGGSKWMPPFPKLKSLRLLYLHFPGGSIVLPSETWRLPHLERLQIHSSQVCITPSDTVDLPRLSHLILPRYTSLTDVIGKMKSLRTLRSFLLAESMPENIKGLGKLNKLEVLYLDCCRYEYVPWEARPRVTDDPKAIWMDALFFSLEKLSNLKQLFVMSDSIIIGADALSSLCAPFHDLELLDLHGLIFSRVPRWIGGLQKLRELRLVVKQIPQEDIGIIGILPCLIKHRLWIPGVPTGRMVIGGTTGFKALQKFEFDCNVASYLTFEDGAMPSLQVIMIELDYHKWDGAKPLGLRYLSRLEELHVSAVGDDSDSDAAMRGTKMRDLFEDAANVRSFSYSGASWGYY